MKTNQQRQAEFRKRKKAAGLIEVRGIYATPEDAERIKRYVERIRK